MISMDPRTTLWIGFVVGIVVGMGFALAVLSHV